MPDVAAESKMSPPSDEEDESDEEESANPQLKISTLECIDDYISNLANAKNTVVGVIQNIFHFLISKYSRLSVTSFTYLEMTGGRSVMVRSLS